MNLYKFVFAVLLYASHPCIAQRIIYSSSTIKEPGTGLSIKKIRPHWKFSPRITVKFQDGTKQTLAKNAIWGYEDSRGIVYRCYKREFFRVVKVSDIVQYSIKRHAPHGTSTFRYFSQDLDSPLRWTRAKARRDAHASI